MEMHFHHNNPMSSKRARSDSSSLSPSEIASVLRSVDDDESFMRDVLLTLGKTARSKMEEIDKALEENNMTRVAKMAHSLKGSAAIINLVAFADAARTCESVFKDADAAQEQRNGALEEFRLQVRRLPKDEKDIPWLVVVAKSKN